MGSVAALGARTVEKRGKAPQGVWGGKGARPVLSNLVTSKYPIALVPSSCKELSVNVAFYVCCGVTLSRLIRGAVTPSRPLNFRSPSRFLAFWPRALMFSPVAESKQGRGSTKIREEVKQLGEFGAGSSRVWGF